MYWGSFSSDGALPNVGTDVGGNLTVNDTATVEGSVYICTVAAAYPGATWVLGFLVVGDASTTTPAAPASGGTLFERFRAGRRMLSQIGPSGGADYAFQPFFGQNKIFLWTAQGNGTTVAALGLGVANTGTATARTVAVTNLSTSLRRLGFVSGAAGTSCGTRHGLLQFYRGDAAGRGGFMYVTRFVIAAVGASLRWFVGFYGTAAAILNVDPSTLPNIVGFGIDAGQTTVRFFNNDGGGAATATDLGASFPATTATVVYEARIFCAPNGGTIFYSLQRLDSAALVEGSAAADIPANTVLLAPQIWMNSPAAAAVAIDVVSQYIETDT